MPRNVRFVKKRMISLKVPKSLFDWMKSRGWGYTTKFVEHAIRRELDRLPHSDIAPLFDDPDFHIFREETHETPMPIEPDFSATDDGRDVQLSLFDDD